MQTDVIIASSTKLDLWILLLENPVDNIILELGALDFSYIKWVLECFDCKHAQKIL